QRVGLRLDRLAVARRNEVVAGLDRERVELLQRGRGVADRTLRRIDRVLRVRDVLRALVEAVGLRFEGVVDRETRRIDRGRGEAVAARGLVERGREAQLIVRERVKRRTD